MSEFKYDWFSDIRPMMENRVPRTTSSIVEVGSFEGRSTLWFLDWCPCSHVTCIDHFMGGEDQKSLDILNLFSRFASNIGPKSDRITILKYDSWDAWPMLCPQSFDLAFVDGSHLACDVMWDLVNAFRCVKNDGLIIADDYSWENWRRDCPKVAIDSFIESFHDRIRVIEKSRITVLRKIC